MTTPAKRSPGRPALAPDAARTKRTIVALTDAERETLSAAAKRRKVPLARFIREAALRRAELDGEA
jgi:hypothetical protein